MTLDRPGAEFYVETPRLRFFCRSSGAEDGIPLLLLHGNFGTSRWWTSLFNALPDEIYAVAPDLRGCGNSEKPDVGYSIEEQAEDLAALVEALRWEGFHLMAHSTSGAIAVEYLLTHAHDVETLTLVDPVPVEGVFTPLDGYLLLEQMKEDRSLLRDALRMLMPTIPIDSAHPEMVRLFEQLVDDASRMAPAAFTEVTRSLAQWNRFGDARLLTLPTLLIWGEHDVLVDRGTITRTLIAIPGANNLEVLRNVGHSPMIEAPVALANRWLDFLLSDYDAYDELRRSAYDDNETTA
ncbi:alpha/beta hydrolase [Caldilinea sp.]|jgi:branched-chain amino acid transport system permease protein|uniref:alpha/beta fold hydrolase n=1 Tax=Caldilinea sp. TaxID=2293560 RepID=UPI001B08A3BE|nr:alpha/beta hydrolase [Caldilinea sp.]MBO9393991.1 alpha/beta hydrolase [Caldilinea sp.]